MHEGSLYHPAAAYSKSIGWLFLAHTPAGFYNEGIRSLTFLVAVFFIGTTLVGLLLSPAFATRMARPLQAIIARARQIADGSAPGAWPRSAIVEYNHLSADLERMAAALKAREEEFIAIFNASPIATAVSDPANEYALIAINDAWSRQFGHARQAVIGRNGPAINLWQSMDDRAAFLQAIKGGISNREIWMLHADGTPILCNLSAQQALIGGKPVAITVTEDITEKRRIAEELRDLNTRLEERVDQRTRDLMDALERLRMAQSELVRSEKLAALGGLVAGIAHELNTPIGNGLMAVSTLHNEIVTFEESARQGLRRSIFEKFIQAINTGTDIAIRNLTRAAELVTSFKQVAIDRTSSHRRKFELIEIVTETVVTLQPMLRRSGTEVQVAVPADIMMDSYPGPLGQVMTNLLQNAVAHAFEGRSHGHVTIAAEPLATSHVRISISDDGNGIPSDQLERIFDPFFTTKMGRGGTGLGLHITHNAIVNVLGGAITVDSRIGHGTRFDIVLPLLAPAAVPEQTVASLA
jgi:PAS domain S-box-containing protein